MVRDATAFEVRNLRCLSTMLARYGIASIKVDVPDTALEAAGVSARYLALALPFVGIFQGTRTSESRGTMQRQMFFASVSPPQRSLDAYVQQLVRLRAARVGDEGHAAPDEAAAAYYKYASESLALGLSPLDRHSVHGHNAGGGSYDIAPQELQPTVEECLTDPVRRTVAAETLLKNGVDLVLARSRPCEALELADPNSPVEPTEGNVQEALELLQTHASSFMATQKALESTVTGWLGPLEEALDSLKATQAAAQTDANTKLAVMKSAVIVNRRWVRDARTGRFAQKRMGSQEVHTDAREGYSVFVPLADMTLLVWPSSHELVRSQGTDLQAAHGQQRGVRLRIRRGHACIIDANLVHAGDAGTLGEETPRVFFYVLSEPIGDQTFILTDEQKELFVL